MRRIVTLILGGLVTFAFCAWAGYMARDIDNWWIQAGLFYGSAIVAGLGVFAVGLGVAALVEPEGAPWHTDKEAKDGD